MGGHFVCQLFLTQDKALAINPASSMIAFHLNLYEEKGMSLSNATLYLRDGTLFHGIACGSRGDISAEIVCVTSMTGYEKILTDPSYNGQIILFTTPHIGVVGMHRNEMESIKAAPLGCVMRCCSFSSFHPNRGESLPSFLRRRGVVAIGGVDTRAIARRIQHEGPTFCRIISDEAKIQTLPQKESSFYSMSSSINVSAAGLGCKVAVIDYGVKQSILRALTERGCNIKIFSLQASIDDIMTFSPHGVLLSNGPHDPKDYELSIVRHLIAQKMPLLGICLGHQLIASALGAMTAPLPHGHRSSNHPVIETGTNRVFITAQNHGYHVREQTLPSSVFVSYRSLLDGSIEGLASDTLPIMTMQCHPEGSPGPCDMSFIFDRFCELMRRHYAEK